LTEDLLDQWSRKVAVHADCNRVFDLWWSRRDRDVLGSQWCIDETEGRGDIGGEAFSIRRNVFSRVAVVEAGYDEIGMCLRLG
jgi:hypothetical protein